MPLEPDRLNVIGTKKAPDKCVRKLHQISAKNIHEETVICILCVDGAHIIEQSLEFQTEAKCGCKPRFKAYKLQLHFSFCCKLFIQYFFPVV